MLRTLTQIMTSIKYKRDKEDIWSEKDEKDAVTGGVCVICVLD